ncbi:MAG: hypothetical protein C0501_28220 [Isosphaera sp.]|nr:hypothetical protein [Isosphaera sp.]
MALQVEPLRKADEQRNKLLADQRLGEAHAQFARLAGRKVNWRLIVGNITDTTVDLEGYNLGNYLPDGKKGFRPYSAFLSVSAWAASTPPRRLTPGGNWVVGVPEPVPPPQPFPPPDPLPGFIQPKPTEYFTPGLEIGKVISKARATRLAAGEKVLVSGKIAYCVVSGPYPDRGIALCIVEAKSPD